MRHLLLLTLALLFALPVAAQPEALYIGRERRPLQVSVGGLYQRVWDGDQTLSQVSSPLYVFAPLTRSVGLSLASGPASTTGDGVASIGGLSDLQMAASYHRLIGSSSVVASLSANLPVGREGLTAEEFQTSQLIGRNAYAFRTPSYGQGFNIAPAVIFAFPLSETWAGGIGVSWNRRGAYEPADGLSDSFDPGDEVMLTAGADYRLTNRSALSGDLVYTLYGADKLDGETAFQAGNKIVGTLQFLLRRARDESRVVARYRTRARSDYLTGGSLQSGAGRALPDEYLLRASYTRSPYPWLRASAYTQARLYAKIEAEPERTLLDIGLSPRFRLSDGFWLSTEAAFTAGSFSGFAAGMGIMAEL